MPAIPAAIMAGGAIASAVIGSKSAKSAAQQQQQAAQQAGQRVVDTVNQVNPGIIDASNRAGDLARSTAGDQSNAVTDLARTSANNVVGAANAFGSSLNPYTSLGAGAANALSTRAVDPSMAQLQIDPGFAFRLQQGAQALQRSAAATGGALGGAAAKQLTRYSQDYSSNEYQNAFNRYQTGTQNLMGQAGMGLQASTIQGSNNLQANEFAGNLLNNAQQYSAGLNTNAALYAGTAGMQATNLTAANSIGGAEAYGNYLTQGASAGAKGTVASGNAISAGISGVANNAVNYLTTRGGGGSPFSMPNSEGFLPNGIGTGVGISPDTGGMFNGVNL